MLWILPTAYKKAPVRIIRSILTTLKYKKSMKTYEIWWGWLSENSTVITDLLADEFNISLKTNGRDVSWLTGKNEHHNISIHSVVRSSLLGSNQHENKWCCAAETYSEVYRWKFHSALDNASPNFAWYGNNTIICELRSSGC